jgi:hypothetical protein
MDWLAPENHALRTVLTGSAERACSGIIGIKSLLVKNSALYLIKREYGVE